MSDDLFVDEGFVCKPQAATWHADPFDRPFTAIGADIALVCVQVPHYLQSLYSLSHKTLNNSVVTQRTFILSTRFLATITTCSTYSLRPFALRFCMFYY